jgi:N-acetyl-gamma-glutamyl-phosphate reductase
METSGCIRAAVVGATGYAGAELVRLLCRHPDAEITVATSERDAGNALGDVHPSLAGTGLVLQPVDASQIAERAQVAFCALPHGTSTPLIASLIDRGLKVIDVGADFRFDDLATYQTWYGAHGAPELNEEAVYGLTEHARDAVRQARLVANPGCYPTGALMALLPLASAIAGTVIVDSKSGTSGAGRAANTAGLFAEVTENLRPYKIGQHRHQPEIREKLEAAALSEHPVVFSPHLLPIARGLLSTCYVELHEGFDVQAAFETAYADEPFVVLRGENSFPEPRNVRGTNLVEIGWAREAGSGRVIVLSAIDNLGKGAAGQAVQNFNVMFGLDESAGLTQLPALP